MGKHSKNSKIKKDNKLNVNNKTNKKSKSTIDEEPQISFKKKVLKKLIKPLIFILILFIIYTIITANMWTSTAKEMMINKNSVVLDSNRHTDC